MVSRNGKIRILLSEQQRDCRGLNETVTIVQCRSFCSSFLVVKAQTMQGQGTSPSVEAIQATGALPLPRAFLLRPSGAVSLLVKSTAETETNLTLVESRARLSMASARRRQGGAVLLRFRI
jgi:hypothetical protein